ncbi:MAG: tyrosine-type recombinase/integrase [Kineosporiaceae bacterium]|nr:tyrosine-type recombinase/integrase [Kineosporiaceae bacterium]
MGTARRKSGVLAAEIEPYRQWLLEQGFRPGTVRTLLRNLSQLGVWLQQREMTGATIDAALVDEVFAQRRALGRRGVPGRLGTGRLLAFLDERGLLAPAPQEQPTALDLLLVEFRQRLFQERNLSASTVLRYERTARRFLSEQALREGVLRVGDLTGADVNAFLLRECSRVSAGSAKGRVAELRSLLRFCYLRQLLPMRLGAAVPPVGGWRLASIPVIVSAADVAAVIDSCDVSTLQGRRNRAIMLLVARLGLRSIEVARLELDDIDWRRGELTVRGKARRQDKLPLPSEVGEALSAYLVERGQVEGSRRVFFTCRAPRRPIRPDLVNDVVERACLAAGIRRFGPHRMRHALAGELLRKGAGLRAIGQVLRHQDLATTALYAKVDLDTLRGIALPWPGADR